MQEPPNEGPDDWYFDESLQRWGRYSGRAHWRRILDERVAQRAAAYVEWRQDVAERLAGRADDRTTDTAEVTALRASIRQRVREQLAAGRTEQAQAERRAAGQAFLARYGLL